MNIPQYKVPKWLRVVLPSILIVSWIGLSAVGGPYFGKISDVASTDLTTFLPSSSESAKVNDTLKQFRSEKTIPVLAVFEKGGKELSSSDMDALKKANESIKDVNGVSGKLSTPLQSDDKKAAYTVIPLQSDGDFKKIFPAVKEKLAAANLPVSYALTGPASFAYDLQKAFGGIDGTLLIVALSVVFVILLVVYRSPFLPFIVLFSSLAALSAAILVVYYLAKADIVTLNGQVQGILFILVIGAATDYSLLFISRFREELHHYAMSWQAAWAALKSSFEPILAAGGTVTAGLLCLLVSDLESNKALGPVGGIGIGFSILAALTLLPAFMVAFGRRVFWPRIPEYLPERSRDDYQRNHPLWSRVGALVRRHPRRIWAGSIVLLLVACTGVLQLKAEGVSQSDLILGKSEARDGQQVLDRHFPAGSGTPAMILASSDKQANVVRVAESNAGVDSISVTATGVDAGIKPVGKADKKIRDTIMESVAKEREKQVLAVRNQISQQMSGLPAAAIDAATERATAAIPSVQSIADKAYPFKDAQPKVVDGNVMLQVTLSDPANSFEARNTIVELRDAVKKVDPGALVGGTSAAQYDTNQAALHDLKIIIPLILGAITIILMLLLRAIVAPLLLLLTTVLSFGATLGIAAVLFNHVWQFPGADPAVIIFGFVFLVALGIDYNIFLMTRVREETINSGVNKGTIKGLVVTGGVITSAGIVLAATFASLVVIPILFLAQIAFIVAFGVLLDTIIVRSLLVPALTLQIGPPMWWPSKLWRGKR